MSIVTISAQDINKLRQMTGAGMMDCRKALTETNGDFEAAIDWLRKQGQKVAAKRSDREAKEGVVVAKTTADNKTGIVVGVSKEASQAGKDVAMQIAALGPVAVDAESVPADVIAREKDIALEQLKNDPKMAGKPAEMLDKIAAGKLNAFFKEQTLIAQAFVKDSSKTVGDYLNSVDGNLKVTEFKRVALG